MPCIERLTVWCCDREWRHLALRKAKRFGVVDVLPEEGVDLMGVQSTIETMSIETIAARPTGSITIVAGEVSTAHQ
jgi:hypothetical protein